MALFGKKAKNSPSEATNGASNVPVADSGADPFAADVFASDDAAAASVDSGGKGGKKSRAAKAPKSSKPKGVKNGSVVGLNIGNSLIKAVEVTAKNGEISVTGVGIVPTPAESYINGNILSVSALSAALRNLWKQAGFKSKNAVISVSGTGSLVVRVIDVPKMTDSELADNMRVDADRYIPFPPSEVVMDFKALRELPSDPDAPNMEVLLAAAQREVIDLHVKVIQSAKLNPAAIDVEPIATARSLQLERTRAGQLVDYDEVTALLNIGATGTEITVLRGDVVVFTRSLPNGGNNLSNAISEAFGVTFPDAERIKIERADALPPAGYDQNVAFGTDAFDEFGGDMNSFSDDVFSTPGGSASQTSTTSSTQTATSEDPFDLDFFNQGPKSEPGAGHSQKDGEDAEDKPIAFNFSFDDDVAAMPSTQNQVNATPAAPAPPIPPVFDEPPSQLLPAQDSSAPTPAPDLRSASPISFGFEGNIPTNTGDPHSIPSAFDFSDFDLPTVIEEGSETESSQTPTFEDTTFSTPSSPSFGFAPSHEDTPPPANFQIREPETAQASEEDSPFGDFGFTPNPETETPVQSFGDSPLSLDKHPDNDESAEIPSFDTGMNFDDIQLGGDNSNLSGFDIGPNISGTSFDDGGAMSFGAGLGESVVADADETALYTAIAPVIEDLSNEVRRSLEFHLGRYPDTSFSRILLVGGGAKLRNLDVYFTQNIGVPTQVAHPFSFVNVQVTKMSAEAIEASSSLCATALGLALRDFID